MSVQDRDPLDIVINGEWATQKNIEYMETLALELLEGADPLFRRKIHYELFEAESHPTLTLYIQEDPAAEVPGVAAYIELSTYAETDACFAMVFGYDNCLIHMEHDSGEEGEDGLVEAYNIVDALLESDLALDAPGRLIAEQLKVIIQQLNGTRSPESISLLPTGEHIADIVRSLVYERSSLMVQEREFGLALSENHTIRVLGRQVVSHVMHDDEDNHELLEVYYEDREADIEYYYCSRNGERRLESFAASKGSDDEDLDDEHKNLLAEEILKDALPPKPTAHDVQLLTQELLEAQAQDAEIGLN